MVSPRPLSVLAALMLAACAEGAGPLALPDAGALEDAAAVDSGAVDSGEPSDATASDARPPDLGVRDGGGPPRLEVHPAVIDLGEVPLWTPTRFAVEVENVGPRALPRTFTVDVTDGEGVWLSAQVERTDEDVAAGARAELVGFAELGRVGPVEASLTVRHPWGSLPGALTVRATGVWRAAELVDPRDVGFGMIERGQTATVSVILSAAEVSREVRLEGDSAFSMTPGRQVIGANEQARLQIVAAPDAVGRHRSDLVITSAGGERRIPVAADGHLDAVRCRPTPQVAPGYPPQPTVGAQLPPVRAGRCAEVVMTCRNHGVGFAPFDPVDLDATNATVSTTFTRYGRIAPRGLVELPLEVCPIASGPVSVRATVRRPGVASMLTFTGEARGPRLELERPAELGPLPLTLSRKVEVSLVADSRFPVQIQSVVPVGFEPGEVYVSNSPREVAPGTPAVLRLTVEPARAGLRQGSLRIVSDDERGVQELPVSFEGVERACDLVIHTPELLFSRSSADARQWLVLEHRGPAPCAIAVTPSVGAFAVDAARLSAVHDGARLHVEIPGGGRAALPISRTRDVPVRQATGLGFEAAGVMASSREVARLVAVPDRLPLVARVRSASGCGADTSGPTTAQVRIEPVLAPGAVVTRLTVLDWDPSAAVAFAPTVPFTVSRAAPLELELTLAEASGTHVEGLALEYTVEGAFEQAVLPLGVTAALPEVSQTMTWPSRPAMDMLWVIDGTASMAERASVQSESSDLAGLLARSGLDVNVVFAGVDHPPDPGPQRPLSLVELGPAAFERALHDGLARGAGGHQLEQPLLQAEAALRSWGQGLALMRPDAETYVLIVSDEPDQSPGPGREALERLRRAAPGGPLTVSVVAGPSPRGCASAEGPVAPAPRLWEAVEGGHGRAASICDPDWADQIARTFAREWFPRRTLELERPPVPGTVRVFVDGVEVPEVDASGDRQWSLEADPDRVVLAPVDWPEGGEIEVRYRVDRCL